MIFDTHAHYDDDAFDEDRDALLTGMREAGVEYIVNIGASMASSERSLQLAKKYPFIYAAVGVHPDEVGELNEEKFEKLREWSMDEKVKAIGEIGLDYYWDKEGHDLQKHWFLRQMELAHERNLPIIVHSREAAKDTLDMVIAAKPLELSGIIMGVILVIDAVVTTIVTIRSSSYMKKMGRGSGYVDSKVVK